MKVMKLKFVNIYVILRNIEYGILEVTILFHSWNLRYLHCSFCCPEITNSGHYTQCKGIENTIAVFINIIVTQSTGSEVLRGQKWKMYQISSEILTYFVQKHFSWHNSWLKYSEKWISFVALIESYQKSDQFL